MIDANATNTARKRKRPDTDHQPITITEVELTERDQVVAVDGPTRLLVRQQARPVAFLAVGRRSGPITVDEVAGLLDDVPPARVDERVTGAPPALTATVVITTCGFSSELCNVLDTLAAQTVAPDEVIIVDNRPPTEELRRYVGRRQMPGVRVVDEHRRGLSHARNRGLQEARGDVVAFLDDDVHLDRGWLAAIVSAFRDESVACVTGSVLPLELQTRAQVLLEQFGGFAKGFVPRRFERTVNPTGDALYPYAAGVYGTGANSAFRVRHLRDLGGFDVFLGTGTYALGGEDLDAHLRVVLSGRTLMYEPAALAWHRHHRPMRLLRKQLFGYGAGLSAMLTKRLCAGPADRRAIRRRAVAGLRRLVSPASEKNKRRERSYPVHLVLLELAGFVYGPFGYWASRVVGARTSSRGDG